jgi:uroporphyrinogen-III decarboxylase
MTGKERLLRAIRGEAIDGLPTIPITMMMAAAEIDVPYRVYAMDAEAHARGQIAISEKYGIDHVSGISDPAVEAADLGAAVIYRDDAPPSPTRSMRSCWTPGSFRI